MLFYQKRIRPAVFIRWVFVLAVLALPVRSMAQSDTVSALGPLPQARQAVVMKDYKKAAGLFEQAYTTSPGNTEVYSDYLAALIEAKDYKEAEKLVSRQQQYQRSPLLLIDLGRVYQLSGKEKKATEQFDAAIAAINGDDLFTRQLAGAFSAIGRDDYALNAYERTKNITQNPYLYSMPMAKLYARTGATDKAVESLLDGAPGVYGGLEDVKAALLEMLGNDPKKLQLAQKAFIKRINLQPENIFYTELLTWLYTQKGDWDGALLQLEAVDERNRETGQRLLDFARAAIREQQPAAAFKAIDAVIAKGKENPLYAAARMQRLDVSMSQLEDNPAFTKDEVTRLVQEYAAFFTEFPQYTATETLSDYARLEAQYNNNPKKGIELLKNAIAQANAPREFVGRAKLQLGDYQVLDGKVWEASLTYSQVDKAFREDMLGEEARFRNGKLAYYRGDFEWAQGQLSVLKASTSELIANDALYLSVLITENMPDSIQTPLLRFAHADLLLFQNKDEEASVLLDSISKAWPKHTLNDDILMLRAEIATKHRDYTKALGYLQQIVKEYGKDVLADDAVFKMAEIYERYLNKPEEAKKYYEQLIIDYPGSTYVQTARQRLQAKST